MGMSLDERFWEASLSDMKQGFMYEQEDSFAGYCCLICGARFEEGEIFKLPGEERFFEARKYAEYHVNMEHGSMLGYLLSLDKKATGLTDVQKDMIRDFAAGLADNEIVKRTGGSASTVRNHRFVLKEKAKQAKLLLAIMELMDAGAKEAPRFVPIHRTATVIDERFAVTEEEYEAIIRQYFPDGPDGPLDSLPRKEKRKAAVLRHIASFFQIGVSYSETEVSERLRRVSVEDYVTIRRYLVDYGYLSRKEDGSVYWVPVMGKDDTRMIEQERGKQAAAGGAKQKPEKAESMQAETTKPAVEAKPDKAARKALTAEYQEREREMGVYQIKNEANGRLFVGASTNLNGLWNKEKFVLGMGSHMNKELQKEWKQFGEEQFSFLVLETVKTDGSVRYDYKDVYDAEGKELKHVSKGYKREVESLKEKWLEKLQPFGDKGYN
ncbi:DUF2087 domain-containing protein [Paenibacillus soyae]|uniref:DUF2087 domain-containing protein n=1 Tax=Paenibacillus soyae TaxID=2969249 RepID=A0A9X2MTC6_9BACL|nr:DUF2087 domain-containing protein [Paenibacillus soyae]MCR2806100.1 DUF2087 domain-containing protein [Paenibacillus soyae]